MVGFWRCFSRRASTVSCCSPVSWEGPGTSINSPEAPCVAQPPPPPVLLRRVPRLAVSEPQPRDSKIAVNCRLRRTCGASVLFGAATATQQTTSAADDPAFGSLPGPQWSDEPERSGAGSAGAAAHTSSSTTNRCTTSLAPRQCSPWISNAQLVDQFSEQSGHILVTQYNATRSK